MLNHKLLSTVSEYQRKKLTRSVYTPEKIKSKKEKIVVVVECINNVRIYELLSHYKGIKAITVFHSRKDADEYLMEMD